MVGVHAAGVVRLIHIWWIWQRVRQPEIEVDDVFKTCSWQLACAHQATDFNSFIASPTQCHQLGTKCSNKCAYDGQVTFNPQHLMAKTGFLIPFSACSFAIHRNLTLLIVLQLPEINSVSLVDSLGISNKHKIMSLARIEFCPFPLSTTPFISFSQVADLARVSSTMLHRNGRSRSWVMLLSTAGKPSGFCGCCDGCWRVCAVFTAFVSGCVLLCLGACFLLEVCVFYGSALIYGIQLFMVFITVLFASVSSKTMPLLLQFQ